MASLTASQVRRLEASPSREGNPQFQQSIYVPLCLLTSYFLTSTSTFSPIFLPSLISLWGRASTSLERRSAVIYCLRLPALDFVASEPSDNLPAGPAQAQHQFPFRLFTSTTPALLQTHSRNLVTTPFQCGITIPPS